MLPMCIDRGFASRPCERFAGVNTHDLRPLGVGEILDRAVTLFVRRFAPLVVVLALVAVPAALLQFVAQPESTHLMSDLQKIFSLPPGHRDEIEAIIRDMSARGRLTGMTVLHFFVAFVVAPLASTAFVIAAGGAYNGAMPTVAQAYRAALSRWLPQLAVAVAFLGFYLVGFVLMFAIVFGAAFAIVGLSLLSKLAGLIVAIPLGVAAAIVIAAAFILIYLAWQLAFVAVALEDPNPVRAIGRGLRRAFDRTLVWRSLAVGTILFAVSLCGALLLSAAGGALAILTHVGALYPVVLAVGGVVVNGLLSTFVVVYAIDVRVRREGYDLALAARLATP